LSSDRHVDDDQATPADGREDRLADKTIRSGPQVARRVLMIGALASTGLAGAGCVMVPSQPAPAPAPAPQPATNVSDSDSGQYADPAGQGRGDVRTGLTDSDTGQWADMSGGGRWGSGLTDTDSGPYIRDQPGNGRRGF
jgi:hypothetical protein